MIAVRGKGLSKGIIMIIYCVAMFFTSLVLISTIMNHGNTDMTAEMSPASFPTVTFVYEGMDMNLLHGYAREMDISYLRDNITPIRDNREISLKINTYGAGVEKIAYEIRTMDGNRLIEDTQVYSYVQNMDVIMADFAIKDLIEEDTEYSLCIRLETARGQVIRYYTRIIKTENYNVVDKLEFAYYFSKTTFDKSVAEAELPTYLESNSQGDNSSFHKVDIHSSLDQVTWGNLEVSKVMEPEATLKEIDQDTAIITLDYYVTVPEGNEDIYYRVSEYFRMRLGTERMYLLDYSRTMDQVFDVETGTIANNKIVLGIADAKVNMMESPDSNRLAFENGGKLYSYNITDNKLSYIFGFYDNDVSDPRNTYHQNDIKIFSVDETGNVHFMVYGYMNRGIHEGQMGIVVYYYDSVLNTVEEEVFIPYDKSFTMLKNDVDQLAYVNSTNECYLLIGDSVYQINLEESTYTQIVTQLPYQGFIASDSQGMAAWVDSSNIYDAQSLVLINMISGKQITIDATGNNRIWPIGFFGEDVIYGLARKNDIGIDTSGRVIYPMYQICIEDEYGTILKTYGENGKYVVDAKLVDNMITLQRVQKDEMGEFRSITDDQILNNQDAQVGKNTVETVPTDNYENIVQIVVRKEINVDSLQILQPKQAIFEGSRTVDVCDEITLEGYYYVYLMGELEGIYENVAQAVDVAYAGGGVVVNDAGQYVYQKTGRVNKNQIMAITGTAIAEGGELTDTLPVCLDTILQLEGYTVNTAPLLARGRTPEEILAENIENVEVLDLGGCSLDCILYYVARDIPVLARMTDGSAVLIIGYSELNIVVMNPQNGEVYKIGMNDSTEWLLENGNRFTTYVIHED